MKVKAPPFKAYFIAMIVVACSAFAFGAFLWFGERNLGTGLVRSQLCGALTSIFGDSVEVGEVTGNFLIGYRVDGLRLSCSDGEAFSAERARIKIDLSSILRGRPAAKELVIAECAVDSTRLGSLLKLGKSSGGTPPVEQLSFRNVTVSYPMGEVFFEDVFLTLKADGMDAVMEGKINGLGFQGKLFIKRHTSGTGASLERLSLKFASGGEVALSGDLLPDLDLVGLAQGITHEALLSLFPRLAAADPHGVLDTELRIAGSPRQATMTVEGKITSANGRIAGFLIESAKASWQLVGRSLRFFDLNALTFGSPFSGEISFDLSTRPIVMEIKLSGEGLDTDKWKARFGWLSFAKGVADSVKADLSGEWRSLSGEVEVRAKSLGLVGYKIDGAKVNVSIVEGKEAKVKGEGKWLTAPVTAEGSVAIAGGETSLDLQVELKGMPLHMLAKHFDGLSPLSPEGLVDASLSLKGSPKDVMFEGSARSSAIKITGKRLEQFNMSFGLLKGELSIKELSARWNGAHISASGAVKGLSHGEPSLNIQGKVSGLPIDALGSFGFEVPEGVSGKFDASWTLSGSSQNPILSAKAASKDVSTPLGVLKNVMLSLEWKKAKTSLDLECKSFGGDINCEGHILPEGISVAGTIKGIDLEKAGEGFSLPLKGKADGRIRLEGPLSAARLNLELEAQEASVGPVALAGTKASFVYEGGSIDVEARAEALGGSASVAGSILLSDEKIALDGGFSDIELSNLSSGFSLRGEVSGQITVVGTIRSPEVKLEGTSPELGIRGFSLSEAAFAVSLKRDSVIIEMLKGQLGGSTFEASGVVALEDGRLRLSANGRGIDVASLFKGESGIFQGKADFFLSLEESPRGLSGSGTVSSERLTVRGFSIRDVSIPFLLEGNKLVVEKGKGMLYGGEGRINSTFDMAERKLKAALEVKGMDLGAALNEVFSSSGLVATGAADLSLNVEGSIAGRLFLSGTGQLEARDGALSGLEAIQLMAAASGGEKLRYRSISASFAFDNRSFYILPGSRVAAPLDDLLYRYVSADGNVSEGKINLNCNGEVNVKVLNAFIGALNEISRISQTEGTPSQGVLEGFLAGFLGGMSAREFKEVSFRVGGTFKEPYIQGLIVHQNSTSSPIPPLAMGPGYDKEENGFKITLNFPEGGKGQVGEQFKKQLLEQLLKQVLGSEETTKNGKP
ncbi:MAG: hypothetical protein PWR28_1015 [Synergistaceae bacterium]|nr:hypothetical protein [Synergistaceae bacterium]